jgi:HSP20 family protein
MAITRYAPFETELESFPGFRMLQDSLARLMSEPAARPWAPPVDIYETENEIVLKADVPEVDPKNVSIQWENGTLTVKGERKFEKEEKEENYRRVERQYGSFSRSFTLPNIVDTENVHASYDKGVLEIRLGKKAEAKPKQIKVNLEKKLEGKSAGKAA